MRPNTKRLKKDDTRRGRNRIIAYTPKTLSTPWTMRVRRGEEESEENKSLRGKEGRAVQNMFVGDASVHDTHMSRYKPLREDENGRGWQPTRIRKSGRHGWRGAAFDICFRSRQKEPVHGSPSAHGRADGSLWKTLHRRVQPDAFWFFLLYPRHQFAPCSTCMSNLTSNPPTGSSSSPADGEPPHSEPTGQGPSGDQTRDRDALLTSIRPEIPVDTEDSRPVERFQHTVLRPVLKLLNPVILDLVAHTLSKYGTGFTSMDRPDQIRRLENLLGQDSRLKRTLLGMAMGHFTQDEFALYLEHSGEIRRRMVELVTERARSQIGDIVRRIDAL